MGAIGGALVGWGSAATSALWGASWGFVGAAVGGAAAGAANAAISGGNIGYGAIIGGIGAGVGYGVGYGAGGGFWGAAAGGLVGGALAGGVGAELTGGDFGQGAWMGAAYGFAAAMAAYGASKAYYSYQRNVAINQAFARSSLDVDIKPGVNDSVTSNKNVRSEMDRAWNESRPGSGLDVNRHEQGGWVTSDANGGLNVQRVPQGISSELTFSSPPRNTVAGFHTHPNTGIGWDPRPSPLDKSFTMWSGVDHYVVSETKIYGIDYRTGNTWDAATR